MTQKICSVCNEKKDARAFQNYGKQCRSCRTEKERKKRQDNPVKLTDKQKQSRRDSTNKWRNSNPDRAKYFARRTHIKRHFGISLEEYDAMLNAQNGVCAICKNHCATGYSLAVDHNHTTMKNRGLLCKNCNTAIGLLKEDITIMENAIQYLISHNLEEVA